MPAPLGRTGRPLGALGGAGARARVSRGGLAAARSRPLTPGARAGSARAWCRGRRRCGAPARPGSGRSLPPMPLTRLTASTISPIPAMRRARRARRGWARTWRTRRAAAHRRGRPGGRDSSGAVARRAERVGPPRAGAADAGVVGAGGAAQCARAAASAPAVAAPSAASRAPAGAARRARSRAPAVARAARRCRPRRSSRAVRAARLVPPARRSGQATRPGSGSASARRRPVDQPRSSSQSSLPRRPLPGAGAVPARQPRRSASHPRGRRPAPRAISSTPVSASTRRARQHRPPMVTTRKSGDPIHPSGRRSRYYGPRARGRGSIPGVAVAPSAARPVLLVFGLRPERLLDSEGRIDAFLEPPTPGAGRRAGRGRPLRAAGGRPRVAIAPRVARARRPRRACRWSRSMLDTHRHRRPRDRAAAARRDRARLARVRLRRRTRRRRGVLASLLPELEAELHVFTWLGSVTGLSTPAPTLRPAPRLAHARQRVRRLLVPRARRAPARRRRRRRAAAARSSGRRGWSSAPRDGDAAWMRRRRQPRARQPRGAPGRADARRAEVVGHRQAGRGGRLPGRRASGSTAELIAGAGPVGLPLVPRADRPLAVPAVRPSRPSRRAAARVRARLAEALSTAPPATSSDSASGSSSATSISPRSKKRPAGHATGGRAGSWPARTIWLAAGAVGIADARPPSARCPRRRGRPSAATRARSSRPPVANVDRARADRRSRPRGPTSADRAGVERARSAASGFASSAARVGRGVGHAERRPRRGAPRTRRRRSARAAAGPRVLAVAAAAGEQQGQQRAARRAARRISSAVPRSATACASRLRRSSSARSSRGRCTVAASWPALSPGSCVRHRSRRVEEHPGRRRRVHRVGERAPALGPLLLEHAVRVAVAVGRGCGCRTRRSPSRTPPAGSSGRAASPSGTSRARSSGRAGRRSSRSSRRRRGRRTASTGVSQSTSLTSSPHVLERAGEAADRAAGADPAAARLAMSTCRWL